MPDAQESAASPERHAIDIRERGSFVSAHCCCGWRGPARRARARAQADATTHEPAGDRPLDLGG